METTPIFFKLRNGKMSRNFTYTNTFRLKFKENKSREIMKIGTYQIYEKKAVFIKVELS